MDMSLPNTMQKYTDDRISVLFKRIEDIYKQQEVFGKFIEEKLKRIDMQLESHDTRIFCTEEMMDIEVFEEDISE